MKTKESFEIESQMWQGMNTWRIAPTRACGQATPRFGKRSSLITSLRKGLSSFIVFPWPSWPSGQMESVPRPGDVWLSSLERKLDNSQTNQNDHQTAEATIETKSNSYYTETKFTYT